MVVNAPHTIKPKRTHKAVGSESFRYPSHIRQADRIVTWARIRGQRWSRIRLTFCPNGGLVVLSVSRSLKLPVSAASTGKNST